MASPRCKPPVRCTWEGSVGEPEVQTPGPVHLGRTAPGRLHGKPSASLHPSHAVRRGPLPLTRPRAATGSPVQPARKGLQRRLRRSPGHICTREGPVRRSVGEPEVQTPGPVHLGRLSWRTRGANPRSGAPGKDCPRAFARQTFRFAPSFPRRSARAPPAHEAAGGHGFACATRPGLT